MSEFNMRKIGQQIATKRKEKNLTQSNLADQLLVSYQAVSNWERGNSLPDIEKLPQLAAILGLSIDEQLRFNIIKQEPRSQKKSPNSLR